MARSDEALLAFQRDLTATLARGLRPRSIAGIDPDRLALMARLAQAKRLGKIARVLPATLGLVAQHAPQWLEKFGCECPLREARSYANGVQFFRFVSRRLRDAPLCPPFALDLARCEIALAAVAQRVRPAVPSGQDWSGVAMLLGRNRTTILRTVDHDVRELLQSRRAAPVRVEHRRVHLAIVPPGGGSSVGLEAQPRVFELDRSVFQWVRTRREMQRVERASTSANGWQLMERLAACGVLEARAARAA